MCLIAEDCKIFLQFIARPVNVANTNNNSWLDERVVDTTKTP